MSDRSSIKSSKRWVVKVGSALLTNDGEGLHRATIVKLAEQIAFLRDKGIEVVLVSSGSVAAGVSQLGMKARPTRVDELQAAAAVGQASAARPKINCGASCSIAVTWTSSWTSAAPPRN